MIYFAAIVVWIICGIVFMRKSRQGDCITMIDGAGYHKLAIFMLVSAILLWPISRIVIFVIAWLSEKFE